MQIRRDSGAGIVNAVRVSVNLVLLEPHELNRPLPADDPRAVHVLTVLRRVPGDQFDVGVVDGPRGKATVRAVDSAGLRLDFTWGPPPPPLPPLTLLVGLARPQTARKILQEATTLGVAALHFVRTERSEPQYAQSSLWSSGEWRDHLCAGAAQAFTTQLPRVTWDTELSVHLVTGSAGGRAADGLGDTPGRRRLALDNYEATAPLGAWRLGAGEACVLAIGPERGWGPRVLRSETAVVAALAILRADSGFA